MRLSREKVHHLSRLIVEDIVGGTVAELLREPNDVRLRVFRAINDELKVEEEVEEEVRRILATYSRKPPEGSSEWEVLYQKHYAQEMRKRGKL